MWKEEKRGLRRRANHSTRCPSKALLNQNSWPKRIVRVDYTMGRGKERKDLQKRRGNSGLSKACSPRTINGEPTLDVV